MAGVKGDYLREIDRRALRTIWKPYLFAACFIALGMLVLCHGCGFTLSDINTGVSAGRTFDTPFATGKNTYQVTVSGHYTRDRK